MIRARIGAVFLYAQPALVLAQSAAPIEPAISPAGSLMQVFVGLVAVLLLIVATGWVTRRFGLARSGSAGLLQVVSSASVGTRERVVVVEVGDAWLVVGVAPGSVNALMTLPKGEASPAGAPVLNAGLDALTPFKAKLQQMLDKPPFGDKRREK